MGAMDEIWQQALDATAKSKLRQFTELAQELSENWRPILDEHYPFHRSFDEIVRDLVGWNAEIQNKR